MKKPSIPRRAVSARGVPSPLVRTSKTDPLKVAWVKARRGALGLTFAPGKQAMSRAHGFVWHRSLAADVSVLEAEHVTRVVCLVEAFELDAMRITHLPRMLERRGIAFTHFPIVDAKTPIDVRATEKLVRSIAREVRAGGRVVVHCAGGLGRTGTIAGCALVELGWSPLEALEVLADARGPRCPETLDQVYFVADWRR